ncbi:TM2 domain-containing protein [Mesocricetibacter intestinalis]|uniref:TM2 domain-containing protein n=1 Tax=Mesocricetibacter intestinalis TaxID=1521930 RepID=A0A4R6V7I2_9PAST|nr:TM2 domain-containing protein [Mesocricetibacter intestinalis]TDQ57437.1 TM2 domain-containing protein [Mesocricetibacter intestinalis]
MDVKQFAESYVLANSGNFPNDKIFLLKEKLSSLPEDRQNSIQAVGLKNPIVTLMLSLFLGTLSIDRFYLGDIGLGILKIVSVLCFGVGLIWVFLDIYFCYKKTKEINFNKIMLVV